MKNAFLTAEWRKLVLVNYIVNPEILKPFLPYKTELDLWEGKCYVSLVAFMFENTKVKGIKFPFHINFEEANLRFYVKHQTADGEWKRGVVFIKEIVPKMMITFIANNLYHEHYQTLEMNHHFIEEVENLKVSYAWKLNNKWNTIEVKAENKASDFTPGGEIDFITEHYWGYTKISETKTSEYEVEHPFWKTYNVWDFNVAIDFEAVYGEAFKGLQNTEPISVMLAEGSEISVGNKRVFNKF